MSNQSNNQGSALNSKLDLGAGRVIVYQPEFVKQPHVLNFDRVLFCDVDDTLITFDYPSTVDTDKLIFVGQDGFKRAALPLFKNIESLKNARTRNHGVVVWSQGGSTWANDVVKALKLEAYVDLIVTKPSFIYDDLPAEAWMGPRMFPENPSLVNKK